MIARMTAIASVLLLAGCSTAAATDAVTPTFTVPVAATAAYGEGAALVASRDPACVGITPPGLRTGLTSVTCRIDGDYVIFSTWPTAAAQAAYPAELKGVRSWIAVGPGWTANVNQPAPDSAQHTIAAQIASVLHGSVQAI